MDSLTFDQSAYLEWQDLRTSLPILAGFSALRIAARQPPPAPDCLAHWGRADDNEGASPAGTETAAIPVGATLAAAKVAKAPGPDAHQVRLRPQGPDLELPTPEPGPDSPVSGAVGPGPLPTARPSTPAPTVQPPPLARPSGAELLNRAPPRQRHPWLVRLSNTLAALILAGLVALAMFSGVFQRPEGTRGPGGETPDRARTETADLNPLSLYYRPATAQPIPAALAGSAFAARIDLHRHEAGSARDFLAAPADATAQESFLHGAERLPLNLRLLRYLVLAHHPQVSDTTLMPSARADLIALLSRIEPGTTLPDRRLFLALARRYRLADTPEFQDLARRAFKAEAPRLIDLVLRTAATQDPPPAPTATVFDLPQAVGTLASVAPNLSDEAIGWVAPLIPIQEGADAQVLRWEQATRADASADPDRLAEDYLASTDAPVPSTASARRLREALWTRLAATGEQRQAFLYALAATRSIRGVEEQGNAPPADGAGAGSGVQTKIAAARLSPAEQDRLWHRLLITFQDRPAELRRWIPELFGLPAAMQTPAETMSAFVRCFAAPGACKPPSVRSRSTPPPTADAVEPSPSGERSPPDGGTPSPDRALFWRDALAQGFAIDDPLPSGLGLSDLVTMAAIEAESSSNRARARLRSLLERVADSKADWWIERQSSWDPLAFNARGPRYGLFQTGCAVHALPERRACRERFVADPAGWLRDDLARLTAVLRRRGAADGGLTELPLLEGWARFYAGDEAAARYRERAAEQAAKASDPEAMAFLRNHWFCLIEDTDTVLLLLRFENEYGQ